MKKFLWFRKGLCPAIRMCLLFLFAANWPGIVAAQKIRVDNIRYELKEDYIEIYYDLVGLALYSSRGQSAAMSGKASLPGKDEK